MKEYNGKTLVKKAVANRAEQIRKAQHSYCEAVKVARLMRTEMMTAKIHAHIVISDAKSAIFDARIDMLNAKLEVLKAKRAIRQAKNQ